MRVGIVGADPTGLYFALARRGQAIVLIDRDAGPVGETWSRRG
jgi:NADPH-dependent glutamate synthase beta subunit-like oxidoreductase